MGIRAHGRPDCAAYLEAALRPSMALIACKTKTLAEAHDSYLRSGWLWSSRTIPLRRANTNRGVGGFGGA